MDNFDGSCLLPNLAILWLDCVEILDFLVTEKLILSTGLQKINVIQEVEKGRCIL